MLVSKKAKSVDLVPEMETKNQALGWIMEMELVSDPNFINALLLNIFRVSSNIKDCQVVIDGVKKRMLVWLELDWWGRKFKQEKLKELVEAMLLTALPSFTFRVIYDPKLLKRSIQIAKGEMHEKKD